MSSDHQASGLHSTTAATTVRPATHDDRPAIERIWDAEFRGFEGHEAYLEDCLPGSDLYEYNRAFVATTADGEIVGFGLVSLAGTDWVQDNTQLEDDEVFTGRDGYLYLGCVKDGWKRRGIGTKLFARRLEWLVENDANRVFGVAWQPADPDRPTSDPLFDKFGFTRLAVHDDYYCAPCPVCGDKTCACEGVVYGRDLEVDLER